MGALVIPIPMAGRGHHHVWHSAEVEFVDSHAVYRYECSCGATDFVYLS